MWLTRCHKLLLRNALLVNLLSNVSSFSRAGQKKARYKFIDETEGLLICIGQNFDSSRPAIEGSLQMLNYLDNLDRQALLESIATHLLHYTDPLLNPLEDFQLTFSRPYNYKKLIVIAKGAAVACIHINATELVRIISKAISLHPEQSKYLGAVLNWLLSQEMSNITSSRSDVPFKCLNP